MTPAPLQTPTGMFAMIGLDQIEKMFTLFGYESMQADAMEFMEQLQLNLSEQLSPEASATVLDPRVAFKTQLVLNEIHGLSFRLLEIPPHHNQLPGFLKNWGVEEIKNNYAVAVVNVDYHPHEELALQKKQLMSEIYDYCQYEQLLCFLDLHITGIDGGKIHPDDLPEIQLAAIQEVRKFADSIALEYPGNPLASATLTAELDIPWLYRSFEEDYGTFKETLREALESGAKGFLIRDTLWREMGKLRKKDMSPNWEEMIRFIETTARDRLIEIVRIVNEVGEKNAL